MLFRMNHKGGNGLQKDISTILLHNIHHDENFQYPNNGLNIATNLKKMKILHYFSSKARGNYRPLTFHPRNASAYLLKTRLNLLNDQIRKHQLHLLRTSSEQVNINDERLLLQVTDFFVSIPAECRIERKTGEKEKIHPSEKSKLKNLFEIFIKRCCL